MPRTADELADVPDPAWSEIVEALKSRDDAQALPLPRRRGMQVLEALQVTARSPLGALALNTGALLADSGWFRILGGGAEGIPDLATVNSLPSAEPPPYLTIAWDVLGGQFAVDGGGLGLTPGVVCYFGPDTLAWQALEMGHGQFVFAAIAGELADVFADLRWQGWEEEVQGLLPADGISVYPPPFTEQGKDIASTHRRPVPLAELVDFYIDMAAQLN